MPKQNNLHDVEGCTEPRIQTCTIKSIWSTFMVKIMKWDIQKKKKKLLKWKFCFLNQTFFTIKMLGNALIVMIVFHELASWWHLFQSKAHFPLKNTSLVWLFGPKLETQREKEWRELLVVGCSVGFFSADQFMNCSQVSPNGGGNVSMLYVGTSTS